MEKRPFKIYLFFSLGFIFMLICAVGAFFYGYKVGTDRAESKSEAKLVAARQENRVGTYPQQDLVSFYHTVLLPYRDFQIAWFASMDKLSSGDATNDNAAIVKSLSKLAQQQYDQANSVSVPGSSPLLQEAQTNYLKGLKLFSTGTSNFISKANTLPSTLIPEQLNKDEYIQNAVKLTLLAQDQLYDAVLNWSNSVQPNIPKQVNYQPNLTITEWKTFPLAVKNAIITSILYEKRMYQPYYPQDTVAKVDQMINNGQASQLNMKSISQLVALLHSTDAIKTNEFIRNKNRMYSKETLPQLPFFYE
ncbi:hypothetical protein BVG16_03610 [Paenibacillus selenitireducens]|uniref:Uncharacterized protein n=1 Tax=Paenibacillus selenitireducens TaxID=1324314 RepID=A0A1T2XNL5_9BACL|nr:hypothetical protein [Paenibacillus selenitireducens]OPA81408.1 hypothetical protein BVG16_03610 [Paenibacillus selenitireducens]